MTREHRAWEMLIRRLDYLNGFAGNRSEMDKTTRIVAQIWDDAGHEEEPEDPDHYPVENIGFDNTGEVWHEEENARMKDQLTWRPVSEKPEKGQIVIATYLNQCGKRRRVRAVYVRQYEEEAGEDDELCVEYCEEQDEWYLKEGWYELVDNWDIYSSVAIVEGVVDYWMPMPPAPDTLPDGWDE